MIKLLNRVYNGVSIHEASDDLFQAISPEYNPTASDIPVDDNGFQKGTFRVTVTWEPNVNGTYVPD